MFIEYQDFCDDPDRGMFVITVIIATIEEPYCVLDTYLNTSCMLFLIFSGTHFTEERTKLYCIRNLPQDNQLYRISHKETVFSKYSRALIPCSFC